MWALAGSPRRRFGSPGVPGRLWAAEGTNARQVIPIAIRHRLRAGMLEPVSGLYDALAEMSCKRHAELIGRVRSVSTMGQTRPRPGLTRLVPNFLSSHLNSFSLLQQLGAQGLSGH